jgi:hypothetical protein
MDLLKEIGGSGAKALSLKLLQLPYLAQLTFAARGQIYGLVSMLNYDGMVSRVDGQSTIPPVQRFHWQWTNIVEFHSHIGPHNGTTTLLSIQTDVACYSEISKEIHTRQGVESYLSALCKSKQAKETIYIISTLESYRRIEWAAEMVRTYPVQSWRLILHNTH